MNKNAFAIYRYLMERLIRNEYRAGDLLPGERELGKLFHTTTMNGKAAVALLAGRGLVKRVRHAGTFAERFPYPHLLKELKDVQEKLALLLCSRNPTYIHWDQETVERFISAMEKRGYKVITLLLPAEKSAFRELLQFLPRLSPRNVTILDDNFDHRLLFEFRELFTFLPCPAVCLNRLGSMAPLNIPRTVSLNVDHFRNGYLAALAAMEKPRKSKIVLGCIKDIPRDKDSLHVYEKVEGLRTAFRERGEGEEVLYLPVEEASFRQTAEMVSSHRNRYLIIALNSEIAAGILDCLSGCSLRCPEDYLLLSIEKGNQYARYDFSAIAMPKGELGEYLACISSCKDLTPFPDVFPSYSMAGRLLKGRTMGK